MIYPEVIANEPQLNGATWSVDGNAKTDVLISNYPRHKELPPTPFFTLIRAILLSGFNGNAELRCWFPDFLLMRFGYCVLPGHR